MTNKFVRYLVILVAGLCCTARLYAQTDTGANYSDSAVVVPPSTNSGSDSDAYSSHESTSSLSKFKQRLPLQQLGERKLNGRDIDSLKNENSWWYNKKEEQRQDDTRRGSSISSGTWRILVVIFWVVIISAFVLIIVLYLRTFTGSSRKIRSPGATAADVQEDIFTTNFDEQINRALADHNYRLATRLLFLRVLRTMAEKGIINYGQDKTNMDYLFELGNSRYARDFMQASRNYEYVWYGNFVPAQSQFAQIRQQLDDLNQKITN